MYSIADLVEKSHGIMGTIADKLKALMIGYRKLAKALLEVGTLLKSQQLVDPKVLQPRLEHLIEVWDSVFPDKPVFNKQHFLYEHVLEFVVLYEMYARVGEEGFESLHPRLSRLKDLVKAVASTRQRANTFNNRMQSNLKPEVAEGNSTIEVATTGQSRGTYNVNTNMTRQKDDVTVATSDFVNKRVGENDFIVLTDGSSLLPKEWEEIYLFVSRGKTPKDWRDGFEQSVAKKGKGKF
jgi:hypothetical protein